MDITLRFDDLCIADCLEYEVRGKRSVFTNVIKYKIFSLHELLFGIVKIFIKAKGFLSCTLYTEIAVFRNIEITEEEGDLIISLNEGVNLNQRELNVHYKVENIETQEEIEEDFGLIRNKIKNSLDPETYLDASNAYSLVERLFTVGLIKLNSDCYKLEKYLSELNEKSTLDFKLSDEKNMKVCVVGDGVGWNRNLEELEGFLVKDKYNYKIITVEEYLKDKNVYDAGKLDNSILDTVECQKINLKENTLLDIKSSNTSKEFNILNANKNIKPKNTPLLPIDQLMSNDGYILADKRLVKEFLHVYYFAIASNGDVRQTSGVSLRRKIDPKVIPDKNRRRILEFLDIEEEMLLSVCTDATYHPGHIIFYDKIRKRIVVSFKSTTTLKEILYDADCYYTNFYEGFAHKRFKELAEKFVKEKISEIIKYLEEYNTKDLLLTGYSLGGGVSSLLSIILQRENLLPGYKVTTLVFSSPPIVSYSLTKVDNVFTVNYKNDYVPRLCYGSVEELLYIINSPNISEKGRFDDLRKIGQMFPKLYHIGRVYHTKRVRNDTDSYLLYKEVDLNFFESLLVLRHSAKHHLIRHLSSVLEDCSMNTDNL